MAIRTLILSGGGGRGAFHVGVYKYLNEVIKEGVDAEHQGAWTPEIIVGTSIGAVNGAAIAQGISSEALERYWLELEEKDVEGIPPGMRVLSRWTSNAIYSNILKERLPTVPPEIATSVNPPDSWPLLPLLPPALSARLIGRWSNLLDTGPLKQTLLGKWGIEQEKIAQSDTTLLISATNVQTGELNIFSNKPIISRKTNQPREDVKVGISANRILASCSIPLVYPWTEDEGSYFWDGAVVANTPLSPALDAAAKYDITEPMEVVVVLMTPWWEKSDVPASRQSLPRDFGQAITWTLDWALLASFRTSLKLTRSFNQQILADQEAGIPQRYRQVNAIIVAPDDFLPVERIIDYDEPESRDLIER
jgi:NTE family protein